MGKRGQFYLMAAIVIIIIITGLSHIYTSIKVSNDKTDLYELVREIHYETKQLVDNRVFAGETDLEVANDIKNITEFYKSYYLGIEIIAVYGDESQLYIINDSISSTIPVGGKIDVGIIGDLHEVEVKTGQKNLYILAGKETNGEKTIAII